MSSSSTISVLVLFTPEAAQRLGNKPLVFVQQVIDLNNRILVNSGVEAKVVLCGAELLSEFEEGRELGIDLSTATALRIVRQSLGEDKFGIQKRRNKYAADIVSVWVELEGPNTVGSAAQQLTNTLFQQGSNIAAEEAFLNVIVTAKAGEPLFHFAHELGHNMGLGHDIGASEPTGDLVFGFARGFVDTSVPFRTVMAFSTACQNAGFENCPRIPFYSSANPKIAFNGKPVGIPNNADNARALVVTIPFVASYQNALFAPSIPGTLQQGLYTIQQKSNGRFVDAHEHSGKDFGLVTRPAQNNDTQRWIATPVGGVFTIQQKSNGRFVDAHEHSGKDFGLVTRPAQNNDTQKWILMHLVKNVYTIQQLSNRRFVDAHVAEANKDFALVTRGAQNNDTQRWILQHFGDSTFTLQQKSSGRFMDAHEIPERDFALVTRSAQSNDTQRWILTPVTVFYTIQQASNHRFVDAHVAEANKDFALVTRGAQNNDTQRWILQHLGDSTFTLQQRSSGRFMDAHEIMERDFALVTRPSQNNDTQRWIISSCA